MAIEGVPWMVAGGKHSAEVGRQLAFAATNGGTGVTLGSDLKVTALPTPGAAVRISAGSAAIASKFPGASGQSYVVRGVGATDINVAKAGTSTTTRYVIIRITDPAYAGQPVPASPLLGPYAIPEIVSSITNLEVPFIALAKIVMPANTTTITNAMITDLRVLANPRQRSFVFMGQPTLNKQTVAGGTIWPDFRPTVLVPEWATHVSIVAHLVSIGHLAGNVEGQMTATLGTGAQQIRAANAGFDLDLPPSTGVRHNFTLGGGGLGQPAGAIPEDFRGTVQPLGTEAIKQGGSGYLFTVKGTNVIFQVEFTEDPI